MLLVLTLSNIPTSQIQATRLHGQPSFLQIPIAIPGLLRLNSLWLKVTKTSPVANIVSFVYKMSGMNLLGI